MQPYIPLRQRGDQEDGQDPQRVELVAKRWNAQDALVAQRDKQIEENVRMLSGKQWEVFSPTMGRFVDIAFFMTDKERAFRQRPVINRLLYWFMLTHARMTENPPVVSFQPSPADRQDAILAEVMDVVFKTQWLETEMLEVIDRLVAWMIPSGTAYLKTSVDFDRGDMVSVPQVGMDENGVVNILGQQMERSGALDMHVMSPLECRGEWNGKPWHKKRWHIHRSFLTPAEVQSRWGLQVEPDASGFDLTASGQYLTRLMFGSGAYGAAEGRQGLEGSTTMPSTAAMDEGYVVVDEMWELPDLNSPVTEDSAGGRLLVVLPKQAKVAWDSVRPYKLEYASPIREFRFVNIPGRPSGTSPQEMLNPIQRAYNRGWAQLLEHRALMTNPIVELDANSGLDSKDFVSRPGAVIPVHKRPGVEPFRFVSPPPISGDVWRVQQQLSDVMDHLGNVMGAQGSSPTVDASGQLVKELRFNSDRFIGPTVKRMVLEFARMIEDWIAILPVMWTQEKVLAYAGDDSVTRTLTVLPEMFTAGKVHVIGDIESMLPEGRGDRQEKVERLYGMGAFGQPGTPGALKTFLDLSRFPHLSRTTRPGGVDWVTATQFLGQLLQGMDPQHLPIFEWYDLGIHMGVLEDYMKSPEFLRQDPQIIQNLMMRRAILQQVLQAQQQQAMMMQAQQMAQQAQITGAIQGSAASAFAEHAPAPDNMLAPPTAQRAPSAPMAGGPTQP
jgi:hypothetical protein